MVSVLSTVFGNGGALTGTVVTGVVTGKLLGDLEQDEKKNDPATKNVNNIPAFIRLINAMFVFPVKK
jgi:hypothetical protein